jgi:hypothetical protein
LVWQPLDARPSIGVHVGAPDADIARGKSPLAGAFT